MKEKILNALRELGFELEEMENFGYGFRYEGINYLYMPNDDDVNRIMGEIENLKVATTINKVLLIEVAKDETLSVLESFTDL